MTPNEQETVELFKGSMTRARAKEIKNCGYKLNDIIIAFMENLGDGLWSKMEYSEDDSIAQNVFMVHVATKGHQADQVRGLEEAKPQNRELAGRSSSKTARYGTLLSEKWLA